MTQAAASIMTAPIVFDLPPAVDAGSAAALIADMVKLPQDNEINLNAAAVSAVSLGYLQILLSAFKTFPKLTVSGASPEFAEVFEGCGIACPFGEPPAQAAELDAPVQAVAVKAMAVQSTDVQATEMAPPLAPAMAPADDLATAPAATLAESSGEAGAAAAKTVLTIDDSRTMRDMLRLALAGAGFTVVQAVDGQDGLKVLPQQPVDVIITDINMPKLDGYGVIRAVRSDPAYNETPILVLSTEAEQGSKDIASEAGANGWIVKPFDPDGLIKLINTVCE